MLLAANVGCTGHRASYTMICGTMNELASLRETVRGLDPTFADVVEERRLHFSQVTADSMQTMLDGCNEIVRRLKAGEVC